MIRLHGISLSPYDDGPAALRKAAAKRLGVKASSLPAITTVRRSVDARKKGDVRVVYTVDVDLPFGDSVSLIKGAEEPEIYEYAPPPAIGEARGRPVVVGFGPAGMFAALVLAKAGLRPIVLERGEDAERRYEKVNAFWSGGELDENSNVQFGEGGAGTFSDGKLNTGTADIRIPWVLRTLHEAGAPERILYDAKPHVGTDILRSVVVNMRREIEALGGEVIFNARFCGIVERGGGVAAVRYVIDGETAELPASALVLAIGHSARDTLDMLYSSGVAMEPKPFSMGVRIEHPQRMIDEAQYGSFAGAKALGAADYKLSCHTAAGSAYTFCMCPGGYVVAAASERGGVVTNGMSYSGRAGGNANSALLVGLSPEDFPYQGPLGGVRWQREIEARAFSLTGGYRAVAASVGSLYGRDAELIVDPTYSPGVVACDMRELLPEKITETLKLALPGLGKRLRGFDHPGALLTGPETRSSSPVRILRGASRELIGVGGVYPAGEGAGYAGGIVSSAVDGIKCAEEIINAV